MLRLVGLLAAAFVGIYINVWFLLLILENKSKLFTKKIAKKIPKVSVLIPAYNEEGFVGKTLKSVLSMDYPKNKLEVIVIDNGSADNTPKVVSEFKNVRLLKLKNPGKADALNFGLKHSTGSIIGLLDADTLVTKNCLKKIVSYLEDPTVGVVTTHIKIDTHKGILAKIQNIEYIFSALSKKLISLLNSMYVTQGTLAVIRKNLAKEVGFSNDTLTEDMDLALSIRKRGYKIVNCMDAITYTRIPHTIKSLAKQRIRWYRGFIENTKKHSDMLFSNKFPHLGWFIIPTSFLAIFIGVALAMSIFADNTYGMFITSKSLSYMSLTDILNLSLNNLPKITDFLMDPYSFTCFVFVFATSFVILVFALRTVKAINKVNVLLLPFYMIIYYFLIMAIWILAFLMELFKRKKSW